MRREKKPVVWAGQSVDTSKILSRYPDFRNQPLLTSVGCAIRRPSLIKNHFHAGLREKLCTKGPIMVDSGGFVLMTQDVNWGVSELSSIFKNTDADLFISLDLPPLPSDSKSTIKKKWKTTVRNYDYLTSQFGEQIVPVVHATNQKSLEIACEDVANRVSSPDWIAVGGLVPYFSKCGFSKLGHDQTPQEHIVSTLKLVKARFPKSRIHALGAGSPQTIIGVVASGADSVDSTAWRTSAGFGCIYSETGKRIELIGGMRRRGQTISEAESKEIEDCSCPSCRELTTGRGRIARLKRHFENRSVHNLWNINLHMEKMKKSSLHAKRCLSEAWKYSLAKHGLLN